MIHWGWLILAAIAGVTFGALVVCLMIAAEDTSRSRN